MSEARWLRITEAARHAGVCKNTMRKMADMGHVAVKRTPGGHRRIDRDSLDAPDKDVAAAMDILREIGH